MPCTLWLVPLGEVLLCRTRPHKYGCCTVYTCAVHRNWFLTHAQSICLLIPVLLGWTSDPGLSLAQTSKLFRANYINTGRKNIPGSLSWINYQISDFNFCFVTERCHFLRWLWGWRSNTWSCGAEGRKRSVASSSSSSSCTRGSWLTLKPRL